MLAFSFRMGASTVKAIVLETCKVIWKNLLKDHMPQPTAEMMEKSKAGFWELWNFPNCVGALDGKHCRVKSPPHSGSAYYNYKKFFFSILLQCVSDPDYKFLAVEVGGKGRQNDAGTFSTSALYDCLQNKSFNIPPDSTLPQSNVKVPNVLVADEAYPLKPYLLKPYARVNLTPAKTVFNYRLSRARRCIECAFGILFAKWRILGKDIETSVENAAHIIKCACLLHNVVRDRDGDSDPVFREVRFSARRGGPIHMHRRNNRYTTQSSESS
ncbi:uncharacterized protein LOC128984616 [Macrosteles quadrilineatus]|uniref:uncharacterized protein LOC128984616 n=1 Tax=Macrosteles quadrilineatus TaxID=74068 RepID=UPI0023E19F9A|nr:uncharacterized protein LOC128984616 [Macrosteles quadrilineatus]